MIQKGKCPLMREDIHLDVRPLTHSGCTFSANLPISMTDLCRKVRGVVRFANNLEIVIRTISTVGMSDFFL